MKDPLAAVPVIAPGVEARTDSRACFQLKRVLPEKPGLGAALMRTLRIERDLHLDLDRRGSDFWRLIDGQRDLHQIAGQLARQYSLSGPQSREAVVVFTKQLMLRELILLKLPPHS